MSTVNDTILVTGGAGFIGSNFVLSWMKASSAAVVNLDLLTYAGNAANLASVEADPRYTFAHGDICDAELVRSLLRKHRPRAIVHFAAESHVDRSIVSPEAFIRTNVVGTFTLLEQARTYWSELDEGGRAAFRFLHVSTDEVYGTIESGSFREGDPLEPNSPYSASKAGAESRCRFVHARRPMPIADV